MTAYQIKECLFSVTACVLSETIIISYLIAKLALVVALLEHLSKVSATVNLYCLNVDTLTMKHFHEILFRSIKIFSP